MPNPPTTVVPAAFPQSRGFSMIEVMISVFVLAIGILGVAGMQMNAMRSNQQSMYAAMATQLAQDIADRMRANLTVSDQADNLNPYLFDTNDAAKAQAPAKSCFFGVNCTPAEMAAYDIHQWKNRVVGDKSGAAGAALGLPGGRGVVCRDDTAWDADKGFRWDCSTAAHGAQSPIVIKMGWFDKNADGTLAKDGSGGYDSRPSIVIAVKP